MSRDDPIADLEEQDRRFKRRVQGLGIDYLSAAVKAVHDGKKRIKVVWDHEEELVDATDFFIYARDWATAGLSLREAYDDPQDDPMWQFFTPQFERDAGEILRTAKELLSETMHRARVLETWRARKR